MKSLKIVSYIISRWKLGLVVIGLGLTGSIAVGGLTHLLEKIQITHVKIQGDFRYIDAITFESDLTRRFSGNYLDTGLASIVSEVETHPWVSKATVRRIWPDTLLIDVLEQRPVAIYNDKLYLGLSGDLFEPPETVTESLPRLYGLISETMDVHSHFRVFSDRLIDISKVLSVSRGSDLGWAVTLESGIQLQMGRSDILGRLGRARAVLTKLHDEQIAVLAKVDARYSNGVALSWRSD